MTGGLSVEGLSVAYRAARALQSVDLSVPSGALVGVLGANGAGKSTLARAIAGALPLYARTEGCVVFQGCDVLGKDASTVADLGIAFVPAGKTIFDELTVEEQLTLRLGRGIRRRERVEHAEQVLELFPRLRERLHHRGSQLSGGERQMVALAAALVAKPRLLILDEPSIGLAPLLVDEVIRRLAGIRELGVGILLIEQDVSVVANVADWVVVIRNGSVVVSEDASAGFASSARLRAAYLGESVGP